MLDQPKRDLADAPATFTGNRGMDVEELLLFEIGRAETSGVDIDEPSPFESCLDGLERKQPIGLPGLSEPETLRHYVRLSRKNYSIDGGLYPLGSCTMKHNPRLNEKMARLEGFADIHPLQPQSTVQGALEAMEQLTHWLLTLTNMEAVALSPKAGAHGEICGLMAIKSAIAARGESETRKTVLVPQSAHGTNPASAALLGFEVRAVPAGPDGVVHAEAVEALVGPDVAAIMLTNPNTCGLFERDVAKIAKLVRDAGGYFYCDGANFNAIAGVARPGDFGVDAMHINLHKTFSTPHGGAPRALRSRPVADKDGRSLAAKGRRRRDAGVRPHHRLSWADGHVRPCARLYAGAWWRRTGAGLSRRRAFRQLCPGQLARPDEFSFRRPQMHA
jgi:glycine dehydrogenase subunit 2